MDVFPSLISGIEHHCSLPNSPHVKTAGMGFRGSRVDGGREAERQGRCRERCTVRQGVGEGSGCEQTGLAMGRARDVEKEKVTEKALLSHPFSKTSQRLERRIRSLPTVPASSKVDQRVCDCVNQEEDAHGAWAEDPHPWDKANAEHLRLPGEEDIWKPEVPGELVTCTDSYARVDKSAG